MLSPSSCFELLNDVNMAVSEFMKILDFAAKNSLHLANVKKKRSRKFQIWYDSECRTLKKKLKFISNHKHNNPLDEKTRLANHSLNKEYKGLLRRKKRNHQNCKMEELIQNTNKSNNPNQFWSTLFKSGSKSDPSNYRGICVTSC